MFILTAFRSESEEYQDLKKYRRRGRDLGRKTRILTSLEEKDRWVACKNTAGFAFCACVRAGPKI